MLDINKYKDVILQAAWDSGVHFVSIQDYDLRQDSDVPTLIISDGLLLTSDETKEKFKKYVNSHVDLDTGFGVVVFPTYQAKQIGVPLVRDNLWCYDETEIL
jgi:hypothetical protein